MTMAFRRPHRKSRHGCMECKRRRVKCDETRPICTNCTKRHSECEYGSSTSLLWANEDPTAPSLGSDSGQSGDPVRGLRSSLSPSAGAGTADSFGVLGQHGSENAAISAGSPLNLNDLELMMQWCNTTFRTLSRNEHTDPIWRYIVPEEALLHPFLMHGILALSSLHLARTGPELTRRASYLNRAVAHQNQALALFRELLGDVKESNAKAMFAFAGIVVIYTFAFPHTPDVQDPWSCVDDLYQVLVLARGVQQVIYAPRDFTSFLEDSSFGPILQAEETQGSIPEDTTAMLKQLREANEVCGARDKNHDVQVYKGSIANLEEMLSWCYSGMRASTIAGRLALDILKHFFVTFIFIFVYPSSKRRNRERNPTNPKEKQFGSPPEYLHNYRNKSRF
ncbi:Aflatoxin biosynthesis regulatory protein [Penicillium roqueforti FM164]|uniref:Aflatoxin biosynthesis regulatory protein n=1 Tax=Penicillium roqueforti (strain FM164) TaxID=1365484 RepID=W6PXZ4_PENRF|nr:Aflatoxin biosynthesis regulatory protein [Penicillium roqueforti FM164]